MACRCRVQKVSGIQLMADPLRLLQIVLNLLSNAIKFNRPGGWVSLDARQDERGVELCIEDNGIGIAAADLKRVTEPFVQADARLSRTQEGTGLGLSICKRLVELHQGKMTLESSPDHGTKVTIFLPVRTDCVRRAG